MIAPCPGVELRLLLDTADLTSTNRRGRLNVFAHALNGLGNTRASVQDVFTALREVYARCKGAFACTAMIAGFGILGFR